MNSKATNIRISDELIHVFNHCFLNTENTELIGGGKEPIYLPNDDSNQRNRIVFTQDYFSSALHEISHWCIAGRERRNQVDFGYWYNPDGRTEDQQRLFERVEVKPQALEWIFSQACNIRFRVSADNLAMGIGASNEFKNNILTQVKGYCNRGLPSSAQVFAEALMTYYKTNDALLESSYAFDQL